MAKEELIQFEGLVTEILPDARYRVQLDAGHEIVAYTAGKMKKNRIKTLAGDRVTIEMSPYDLEKGRLIFRHKDERPGGGGARVVHRRAVNSAAGKSLATAASEIAHDRIVSARVRQLTLAKPAPIKKSCTSGLFWGPASHNMTLIDFRPDDISYPPVQPV